MEDFAFAILIIATIIAGVVFLLLGLGASWGTIGVVGLFSMMAFACYIDHLD